MAYGGYSYVRFKRTQRIFRDARQQANPFGQASAIRAILREGRNIRGAAVQPYSRFRHDGIIEESDEDDVDYTPGQEGFSTPKKSVKPKTPKRKAEGLTGSERRAKASKKEFTEELTKEERKSCKIAFVSFQFTSEAAKTVLRDLAIRHKNDVTDIKPRKVDEADLNGQTYFEKLDEEAALVDNHGGRALRNRKVANLINDSRELDSRSQSPQSDDDTAQVPKNNKSAVTASRTQDQDMDIEKWEPVAGLDPRVECKKCHNFGVGCVCHLALAPKARQLPSIVAKTPRKDKKKAKAKKPSRKGKDRADSPDEPNFQSGLVTPPRTNSHASNWNGGPSSSMSPTPVPSLPQEAQVWGPQFYHDEDQEVDRIFRFEAADSAGSNERKTLTVIVVPDDDGLFHLATRWTHPISFKSYPRNCHFCANPALGVWGQGERTVALRRHPNSAQFQYLEVGPGPRRPPTQMCLFCSVQRLHIMSCRSHSYSRLDLGDPEAFEERRKLYGEQLLDRHGEHRGNKLELDPCSICTQPAIYRCCAEQTLDKLRKPLSTPNRHGCGLKVCSNCRNILQTRFPNAKLKYRKLRKAFDEYFKEHPERQEGTLRRDVIFICHDSLLERTFAKKGQK
ncbi:uncharacterized protein AB675_10748 [Cyphellophora attinorum]|uniref:Uncharacterized protein n=1 Tax=Cyphellophora attinorum TaxID=1664694 RepID=A0A0N0NMU1_9EURO|nr:uncharacterized protein AB675_10748 [Phialophora attinorum]KPI40851.1 hypothetical protein AB675_10748 [Phialophora attinorum]